MIEVTCKDGTKEQTGGLYTGGTPPEPCIDHGGVCKGISCLSNTQKWAIIIGGTLLYLT